MKVHIDASPWARAAMQPGDRDLIEAECLVDDIRSVILLASSPRGPYSAQVAYGHARSYESPLVAFRLAVDMRRRMR